MKVVVATVGFALLCVSCASQSHPSLSGAFPLAEADVLAIQQLVESRPDIAKPIQSIHTDRPNHAEVSSGRISWRVGSSNLFTVAKRHGKWIIDSAIQEEHIIAEGS